MTITTRSPYDTKQPQSDFQRLHIAYLIHCSFGADGTFLFFSIARVLPLTEAGHTPKHDNRVVVDVFSSKLEKTD